MRQSVPPAGAFPQKLPFYYGWVMVVMAAIAMTATLPGRTHGLGLITTPLMADLGLSETVFAALNMAGSLFGAAFCLPTGWLIDRRGVRLALAVVLFGLALSVLQMSFATGAASLLIGLILVRGFGQSVFSIVSMAMIGKWFQRRLGVAMGVFTVLLTFGFIGTVLGVGWPVEKQLVTWRDMQRIIGATLLVLIPFGWVFVRSTPEACGVEPDPPLQPAHAERGLRDLSLREALRTPAFWILLAGASAFNAVWSAVTLFNESILAERGFSADVAVQIMGILTGVGLLANLVSGAVSTPRRIPALLGAGMVLLAAALAAVPSITTLTGIRLYAAAMGATGGIVTVVFFSAWGHAFGRTQLGRIQGAAQLGSVFASAVGPLLLAQGKAHLGSYNPVFTAAAVVIAILAIAAFCVRMPNRAAIANGAAPQAADFDESLLAPRLQPAEEI